MPTGITRAGDRFWSKVDQTGGCWLWTGSTHWKGYGQFWVDGHLVYAHRFAYELLAGPVPEGWTLDHRHTCPKNCVNPAHLRIATPKQQQENHAGAYSNSISGIRGVYWSRQKGKWHARVSHNRRYVHVGFFASLEEAAIAVVAKRNELFTHNDIDREAV